jgi:hypothetical protein
MPRAKKEEVKEEKKTTKSTKKTEVDSLEKAFEEFNNYINLDFSKITTSLVKDIKANEESRNIKVARAIDFIKKVELTCRGYYMDGNQFALAAINLHLKRMNDILEVYEFLYTQIYDVEIKKIILNNIIFVIQDMLTPRKYEVLNSFGKTYEQFVIDFRIASELVNKSNYYTNQLNNLIYYRQ